MFTLPDKWQRVIESNSEFFVHQGHKFAHHPDTYTSTYVIGQLIIKFMWWAVIETEILTDLKTETTL